MINDPQKGKSQKKPWAHEALDYLRTGQGTEQLVLFFIKIEMETGK